LKRLLRALHLPPLWQRDVHAVIALHYPATTPLTRFTRQVGLLERIGRIVSLDAARRGELGRINFVLLLENPGGNMPHFAEWLRDRGLPGAVLLNDQDIAALEVPDGAGTFQRAFGQLTIVNAGGPMRGELVDRASVMSGIVRTDQALAALGHASRDYAVRWSAHAGLAVDVMEALRARGYGSALWPVGRATVVRGVHPTRVLNLTWLPAPGSVAGLMRTLQTAVRQAAEGALGWLPPLDPAEPTTVEAGGAAERVLAFENIMRESRPYASDPAFYEYLFTRNPDRGSRVDYYAVTSTGRITAIGYNFHTRFSIDGEAVPGVYWSSWRKLPGVAGAGGFLLLKALSAEPVVGAYHPSASAREALRSRTWKRVAVSVCTMRVQELLRATANQRHAVDDRAPRPHAVQEHESYPAVMDPILAAIAAEIRFTIARTPDWCRWRFDEYPLATVRYFVADAGRPQAAYAVTLRRGSVLSVADFWAPTQRVFAALLHDVSAHCQREGIVTIGVETSRADLVEWMRRAGAEVVEAHNYYHFNVARSRTTAMRALMEQWETLSFHETQASGDVLQR
jgi:hypothetical protein